MGNDTWLSQEIGWEIDFVKKVFGNSLFGRMIWSQGECKKPVHFNHRETESQKLGFNNDLKQLGEIIGYRN